MTNLLIDHWIHSVGPQFAHIALWPTCSLTYDEWTKKRCKKCTWLLLKQHNLSNNFLGIYNTYTWKHLLSSIIRHFNSNLITIHIQKHIVSSVNNLFSQAYYSKMVCRVQTEAQIVQAREEHTLYAKPDPIKSNKAWIQCTYDRAISIK